MSDKVQKIRFVDLKTGNTFDGTAPHVFWFDGEQSTGLIYSQPICFISQKQSVSVSIEENDVFSLVNTQNLVDENLQSIYGFNYHDINSLKTNTISSIGSRHHNYYVHIIYVIGSAKVDGAGEYIVDLNIDDEVFQVGADFYDEDESLLINLMNNGIEIPEMVQKAIYDVNVHEESKDNILLNRKWKELLSNLWEISANKGSYKSLFNSLKWFEYGDNLRMCEVWKNIYTDKYFVKDIQQMLTDKFSQNLNGFAKTTYFALYCALEKPITENGKVLLDDEMNPVLEKISSKWSINDLALKLCLLGNFYETYFMPIHLDLLHCTIEDVVYTNTFKVCRGTSSNRYDYVNYCSDINCNIKDGDVFRLDKVKCYVGPSTLFASTYNTETKDVIIAGVQRENVCFPDDLVKVNGGMLTNYASQLYNEIGAIVDFDISIPYPKKEDGTPLFEDSIKRSVLIFKTYHNGQWVNKTITEYRNLSYDNIKFSLLCPVEGDYDVRLQFDSVAGITYTKHIKFSVIDTVHTSVSIYKIHNLGVLDDCEVGQPCQINDYISSRRHTEGGDGATGIQYVPSILAYKGEPYVNGKWKHTGVCLNHLLIYELNPLQGRVQGILQSYPYLAENYFVFTKPIDPTDINSKGYLICIRKQYGEISDEMLWPTQSDENWTEWLVPINPMRNDHIFMPEFHKLIPLVYQGEEHNIESYKVTDEDTLCIIPEISYGKYIAECDWTFVNASRPDLDPIQLSHIKEPFITNSDKSVLPKGYYNIIFKYRLTNEDTFNTVTIESAFIKV